MHGLSTLEYISYDRVERVSVQKKLKKRVQASRQAFPKRTWYSSGTAGLFDDWTLPLCE